jgi:hypothetical protein
MLSRGVIRQIIFFGTTNYEGLVKKHGFSNISRGVDLYSSKCKNTLRDHSKSKIQNSTQVLKCDSKPDPDLEPSVLRTRTDS